MKKQGSKREVVRQRKKGGRECYSRRERGVDREEKGNGIGRKDALI